MARTVLSVALRQSPKGKSGSTSTRGNVVASIASMEKAAPVTSSSQRVPPKRRARMAKKVETLPEKKTSKAKTNVDQESKGKQKGGGAEGLKAKYVNMIAECIFSLQQKNGSSRPVIANQLKLQFAKSIGYNEGEINLNIKLALKKGLEEGVFKMAKVAGKGSGSYKLTESEVKKLKKKLQKQRQQPAAAAKTKQQPNMDSFISRTPKTNVPPEMGPVKTPDSYVLLQNVLSPQFNEAKDKNHSYATTPKSTSNKSSMKKKVKTPNTEDDTIVKTPKEDERKLRSGSGRSSKKKVAKELVTFSSSSPSLRRNVKK